MRLTVVRDLWLAVLKIARFGASVCRPLLTALSVKWQAMGLHSPPGQSQVHAICKPLASNVELCNQFLSLSGRYKRCLLKKKVELELELKALDPKEKRSRLTEGSSKSAKGDSSEVLDEVWKLFTADDVVVDDVTLESLEPEVDNSQIPQTPPRRAPGADLPLHVLMTPDPTPHTFLVSSHQLGLQSNEEQRPLLRHSESLAAPSNSHSSDVASSSKSDPISALLDTPAHGLTDIVLAGEISTVWTDIEAAMEIDTAPLHITRNPEEHKDDQLPNKEINERGETPEDLLALVKDGSVRMATPTDELEEEAEEKASQLVEDEDEAESGEDEMEENGPEDETGGGYFSFTIACYRT